MRPTLALTLLVLACLAPATALAVDGAPAPRRAVGGTGPLDAAVITAQLYRDNGNTTGLGNNASLPSCLSGGDDSAEDAWYKVTLNKTGKISAWITCASVGPPSYDTRLAIFDESLSIVACNDDDPGCALPNRQSRITDQGVGAGTYYIVVDGWNGQTGDYELNVEWSENGPACSGSNGSNPTLIGALPYMDSGSTTSDCDDALVLCELGGNEGGPDHWYRVTVDVDVYMDVTTLCEGADIDTRVAIMDSTETVLFCNDDDPSCASGQSKIEDALLAPGNYYIVVDSADPVGGSYTVQVDTTHAPPGAIPDYLPDMIVRQEELYDNDFSTEVEPGRTHLRFSNATANIGQGKLYLFGVFPANPDGTIDVGQRIFRETGDSHDRDAGTFVYHAEHDHIHVEDWAVYRIREVTTGSGVGPILIEGPKTSFCILDLMIHDSSLPGFPSDPEFPDCGSTVQGQSVGWADVYAKHLPGQSIDITDLPDGEYWLESEVDPTNSILESDETNNIARVKFTIGSALPISADVYEPNDSPAQLDTRGVGTPNSPVLGPCGPNTNIPMLTVHSAGNDDYYRFYIPDTGVFGDAVWISFDNADGNLDLELLDDGGSVIDSSETTGDTETISLEGVGEGWYDVRVFSPTNDTQADYMLSIDPPENGTPTVVVQDPPPGDTQVLHGFESYSATWSASDPENNETWVTLYINSTPSLNGGEMMIPTSQNTPGDQSLFVINTAYLPLGTFYVYVEITDGGTVSGDWSEGTITLVDATSAPPVAPMEVSRLLPSIPNPFNPSTLLRVELLRAGPVSWRIYDVRGALVRSVANGWFDEGFHERRWDGRDDSGRFVASGVYYNVFRSTGLNAQEKILLLK